MRMLYHWTYFCLTISRKKHIFKKGFIAARKTTRTKSVKNAIMLIDFVNIARNICSSRVFRIPFSSYECLLRSVQPAMISVRCFMARSQSEVLCDAPSFKLAACRIRKELNQCEVQTTRPELFEQR